MSAMRFNLNFLLALILGLVVSFFGWYEILRLVFWLRNLEVF